MRRKPRVYVADLPHHIIQRGNNRSNCFFANEDYEIFLDYLSNACQRYGVALHAYVLMTNHSHLLMTPQCKDGISQVMQSLGRCYVQYINQREKRSGTLWEGRHRSSLVDTDGYLLACYRYIELNPVRAGMVQNPGDYPWSSYRVNACGLVNTKITPHSLFLGLGGDGCAPHEAYRKLFDRELEGGLVNKIRMAAQFSIPLGDSKFKHKVEQVVDRKLGYAKRGRPAKGVDSSNPG